MHKTEQDLTVGVNKNPTTHEVLISDILITKKFNFFKAKKLFQLWRSIKKRNTNMTNDEKKKKLHVQPYFRTKAPVALKRWNNEAMRCM